MLGLLEVVHFEFEESSESIHVFQARCELADAASDADSLRCVEIRLVEVVDALLETHRGDGISVVLHVLW